MKHNKITIAVFSTLLLANCSSPAHQFRPQIMGYQSETYEQDLASCRQLAYQKDYSAEIRRKTIGGAAIGGVAGGVGDGVKGGVVGAILGGAITSISQKSKVEDSRKREIIGCMKGKGHQITG